MKKIIYILLIALFITGCGEKTKIKTEKSLYFVFATPLKEHEIWLKAKDGFDKACREKKIHGDWLGPTAIDTAKMEEVIETAIAQKADAIITQGVISKEIINKAKEKGIPILLVDSDIKDCERFAYLGKNFNEQAELFLSDIEKKLGKDVFLEIGIQVAEKDFDIASEQIKEIENVFAKHEGGYVIKTVSESKSDSVRAKKEWLNILSSTSINVAINFAGESAISCNEAAKDLKIRDTMLIYGVDDMPETIKLIKDKQIDGSVATSFYNYGYEAVNWLYDYLVNEKELEQQVNSVKLVLVTKENVDNYQEELK
ncbi:substrate-binding domain-containing protein [Thomasclavelia saccharogumia]|uniref:substrate-binding domain-containing protein n=1 Tax=Thomasclavelia saccharogumia TaxID=341225 RepID=UPI00047C3B58|nr:substrate-binding domain-containing protein [Thomasclavelia saccharogumia]